LATEVCAALFNRIKTGKGDYVRSSLFHNGIFAMGAMQIATQERSAGEEFVKNVNILDRITRAYGILSSARLLSTEEMLDLFSWVRLGAVYGIIDADIAKMNELTETMQAATLACVNGENLSGDERDEIRAKTVRKEMFDKQ